MSQTAWSVRPGGWLGVLGAGTIVVLPPAATERAAAVWALVDGGAGFEEVLDALLAGGLRELPAFAVVVRDGDRTRVLVRGDLRVDCSGVEGDGFVEGATGATWAERTFDDVTALHVRTPDDGPADAEPLRLPEGLVRLSGAQWPPGPEAAPGAAEVPQPAAAPIPPPPSEPPPPPLPPTAPPTVPPTEPPSAPPSEPEVPPAPPAAFGSPLPPPPDPLAPHEPVQPSAPVPPADPLVAPVPAVVADPGPPEPPVTEPFGLDALFPPDDDEDAYAEDDSQDDGQRDDDRGPLGDPFDDEPITEALSAVPPAPPEPAEPADSPSAPDRPVARLLFSGGQDIDVDRPVVIGRAPSPSRVDPAGDPHLVPVASPHKEVSATHLEVRPGSGADHGMAVATDLGSTNGTLLLQPGLPPEELRAGVGVPLVPGAVLDLGDGVSIRVVEA